MIPSLLGFNESEETRGLPINLQLVTVYTYPDCFILKMSMAIQRVRTNLVIVRKNAMVNIISKEGAMQIDRSPPPKATCPSGPSLSSWAC